MKSAGPVNPEENRQYSRFDQLNPAWWRRLEDLLVKTAPIPAGLALCENALEMPWFNRNLRIHPGSRDLTYPSSPDLRPSWQEGLVVLSLINYLFEHRQLPPATQLISENHLPGGTTFFRGPHVSAACLIADHFAEDGSGFLQKGLEWGGVPADFGEFGQRFTIFPGLDWYVVLWEADEEFTARAQYLFDRGLSQVFALDVIWALGNVVAAKFTR